MPGHSSKFLKMKSLNILHTESSLGLGGQEFRILNECLGMQARGHKIFLVVQPGSQLLERAQKAGLMFLPLRMNRVRWGLLILSFLKIIKQYDIDRAKRLSGSPDVELIEEPGMGDAKYLVGLFLPS